MVSTEERKLIKLTTDIVFKAVFGRDKPDCKMALKGLLNAILADAEDPITEITYVNPFNMQERQDDKLSVMDIKVTTQSGQRINVEMQVIATDFYTNRVMYYGAKLLTETLKSGDEYYELKKSIVISIMEGNLFPQVQQCHTVFAYKERQLNIELSDLSELHFIELCKIEKDKPVKEMTPVELWGTYILCAGQEKYGERINEILKESEEINMAERLWNEVTEDERMRAEAFSREIFLMDQKARQYGAEQRGLKKGREEAMEKVALIMLGKAFDLSAIAEVTGFTEEKLAELKKSAFESEIVCEEAEDYSAEK